MNKKRIGLILCAVLLVGGTTTYAASSKVVQATYKSFQYKVNGYALKATTKTQPVVINNKVYIPIDLATEALKTNITADTKTGTINFGEKLNQVPIFNEQIDYPFGSGLTKDASLTNTDGNNNKEVIRMIKSVNRIDLKPNGKYQTLVLNIKAMSADSSIEFKDGETFRRLKTSLFSPSDGVAQVEVNIAGINKIEVSTETVSVTQNSDTIIYPSSYYK